MSRSWILLLVSLLLTATSACAFAQHSPIYWFSSTNYGQNPTTDRYPSAIAAFSEGWSFTAYTCANSSGEFYDALLSAEADPNDVAAGYPAGSIWWPYAARYRCSDGSVVVGPTYDLEGGQQHWAGCEGSARAQGYYPGEACPVPTGVDPGKSRGKPACQCGDPVDPSTGNAFEIKTEYRGDGAFPLELTWTYNSSGDSDSTTPTEKVLGANRTLNYLRSVRVSTMPASAGGLVSAYLTRADGKAYIADFANGVWTLDADVDGVLSSTQDSNGNFTGFTYLNELGQTETYDSSGDLASITDRNGFQQTLTRNSTTQITSVQDSVGRTLTFSYDTSGRLSQVTQPDGGVIGFAYDSSDNLQKVTYPDGSSVQYNYGQTAYTSGATLPNALTSVVDEAGTVYTTTTYNAQGLAIANALANNVAPFAFSYQIPSGTAVVTEAVTGPLGAVETFSYTPNLGVNRST